jgi:hypothetical protein
MIILKISHKCGDNDNSVATFFPSVGQHWLKATVRRLFDFQGERKTDGKRRNKFGFVRKWIVYCQSPICLSVTHSKFVNTNMQ